VRRAPVVALGRRQVARRQVAQRLRALVRLLVSSCELEVEVRHPALLDGLLCSDAEGLPHGHLHSPHISEALVFGGVHGPHLIR
jgi:hypothetical protein